MPENATLFQPTYPAYEFRGLSSALAVQFHHDAADLDIKKTVLVGLIHGQ